MTTNNGKVQGDGVDPSAIFPVAGEIPISEMPAPPAEPNADGFWCSEEECEIIILVRVRTVGKRSKVTQEVMQSVARVVGNSHSDVEFRLAGEPTWWRYDKFGDDMGNHPGHDRPLVPSAPPPPPAPSPVLPLQERRCDDRR